MPWDILLETGAEKCKNVWTFSDCVIEVFFYVCLCSVFIIYKNSSSIVALVFMVV